MLRAAVGKIYSQLDHETALHHLSVHHLKAIAGQVADQEVPFLGPVSHAFKFETELSHCHIDVFVDACVQSNGGLIDGDEENVAQKLNKIIELVSAYFPDPQARMKDDLKTFALKFTHKPRLDVDTDLKGLIKAQHDFIRRSEQNSSNITSSMTDLLRRSSLHINKGLTALPSTVEVIQKHALGSNHRHSKFAARTFAFCKQKDNICSAVVESIADSLNEASEDQLVAHLVSLGQFACFVLDAFKQKSDVITVFLLRKLLMDNVKDDGEEWVEDDEVSDNLKAKIAALKLSRYRTISHANSKNVLTPVLKMLVTMLRVPTN
ncbi:hypothetical protein GGU11DRAFT_826083 [Lentinula aff. detonsa]|nr:hypothetical protein GGU11DRAFT_826083 [Lentinula aff. detonsa]